MVETTYHDTIFALSSGRVPAAIAVVRISGPRAGDALKALTGRVPAPRQAALARVRDARGEEIDQALALWFPGPASETGEDVAELQLHGGHAVIAATLAALGEMDGLRLAEAGEFTRRGFENGKLDLTEVEGLADLVLAETEAQRRQALRQLKGLLSDRAESWRERLIAALALVEARIDFSDEADVPEDLLAPARNIARGLADEIGGALSDGGRGERLREGLVVAIAGPPNAGKSTLLNRIARRDAAIVSPYAGTTRDVIEVHLDLGGYPVTVLDTAGVRETDDPVEMEGVRRARERAAAADLILWVIAADAAGDSLPATPGYVGQARWLVRNKADLADLPGKQPDKPTKTKISRNERAYYNGLLSSERQVINVPLGSSQEAASFGVKSTNESTFTISAATGFGVDTLIVALKAAVAAFVAGGEPALITRARHRQALTQAHDALVAAAAEPASSHEDLIAEELRRAATALGRLTGRVDVEDVLDVIFRDFCIGK